MRPKLIGLVVVPPLLLTVAPCRVLAQPQPALTPAEARAALAVLNDPKKRAEVTATLEAIAKAQLAPLAHAAAAPAAPAPAPAKPAQPEPPKALALAPNSLGAQVLRHGESFVSQLTADVTNAFRAMQSLPLLWSWLVVMATTPLARGILLDAAWRLAVVLACGMAVEYLLRGLMQRPIAALEKPQAGPPTEQEAAVEAAQQAVEADAEAAEADEKAAAVAGKAAAVAEKAAAVAEKAADAEAAATAAAAEHALAGPARHAGAEAAEPGPAEATEYALAAPARHAGAEAAAPGPADATEHAAAAADAHAREPSPTEAVERAEAGEIEPPARPHHRIPAWALLHRLPLVLARLLLDLVPVAGFTLVGHLVTASPVGEQTGTRVVLLAVVDAYALCAVLLCIARMLLSPHTPRLRLFQIPSKLAAYLMRWIRRIVVVGVVGYVIAEVGLLLGMSEEAHRAVLKTDGFIWHACLAIMVLQQRRAVRRRLRAPPDAATVTARVRNALASVWHWIALFVIIATWLVWAVEIPNGFAWALHFSIVTGLLLVGARLLLIVLDGSLDRLVALPPDTALRYPGLEERLRLYHPGLSVLLRGMVYVLCMLALLQLYGVGSFTWFAESELGNRIVSACGTMVVTLLVALAAWEAANAALQRHLSKLAKDQQITRSARLRTLLPLVRSALLITILVFAGLTVLSQIGINIAPLLAGAGIIGVAIGFGSQKLVQDFITGIFLLLENAMQVGEFVTVSGLSGTVEALSVRTMRLRAGDGSVHIIPFSSVTTVTNVNRGLGNASVSVTVDYDESTDRVCDILTEIVAGMRGEPDFATRMLSDLQLWGVDKVDGAGATIVGQVVCTDSGRWSVQREFNRRMKLRFQELGIRLYNPMRNVAVTLTSSGPPPEPLPEAAAKDQMHERSRAAE
ncbi:MAG TPA: mechanosensitive ion channel domain-containing protein [Acetobacteraceae bacterium]|nr:mechanosensitive ion channel domain-containing protein [Acetobacteraceae bacterium]